LDSDAHFWHKAHWGMFDSIDKAAELSAVETSDLLAVGHIEPSAFSNVKIF
jgi:hypothetical protein